ncbi:ATP-binding cassette domain-containing protein [Nocardioides sp. NPDC101246]|uniref:ATP-binding cassette domain-containing protein n=1 Tax=Nocardioides sp. NPDC101246 TaxID=3364336 RepID=UPI003808F36A
MTLHFDTISYRYRPWSTDVLDGFNYILPGGLTILLGPNGAGKSTLLRLGASVTNPKRGRVTVDSISSKTRDFRRHVSWMPQNVTAMTGLTAREQVSYTGWLKGMSRSEAWAASMEALATVNLAEQADKKAKALSGGQLRRLGVASATIHRSKVLLLDEPTAGMDPTQRRSFRDILTRIADRGVNVLMSTHDVADLAEDATHVTVMSQGHVRYDGPTHEYLRNAPVGTPANRLAEAAYTALTLG